MNGGVPPSGGQPSSTPPSKGRGRPDENKRSKDFRLPDKKGKIKGEKEDEKQKGLFDLAGKEMAVKEREQNIQQNLKAESVESQKISETQATSQMSQVSQLIQKMVQNLRIGEVGGKNFASIDLSAEKDVPTSFAGSNLTLSYQANSLTIHFDNFMTPQQENQAISLVEKHKDQLEQMVQSLQAKNIQVSELIIGTHRISLPEVQPLPPPFQAMAPSEAESQQRQREREGEGEERRGGEGQER